ncbi:hypothetical protein BJY01DRAFT_194752 [Aspergillus pseudoustus]|uniref:Secreted protein n=1 Tax=Aspergillus pseudoustus TaxID=1810923 RepID=A0ABR4KU87_9EURO
MMVISLVFALLSHHHVKAIPIFLPLSIHFVLHLLRQSPRDPFSFVFHHWHTSRTRCTRLGYHYLAQQPVSEQHQGNTRIEAFALWDIYGGGYDTGVFD